MTAAKPMDETTFWSLIDQARKEMPYDGPDEKLRPSLNPDTLARILAPLSNEEVYGFGATLHNQVIRLNEWKLWGAGYVIAGGMSDDSFHYFRTWLVGKGKEAFDLSLRDPDALGPYIDDEEVDNELLEYVPIEVLEKRGIDGDPREASGVSADDEPSGKPFDEDTVEKSYPKLAKQFGH